MHSLPIALLVIGLCAYADRAAAANPSPVTPQKEELEHLRLRIDTLQKRLAASEETKADAADALRESERSISQTNRALRDLAHQQAQATAREGDLKRAQARISAAVQNQHEALGRSLYQRYLNAQPDVLKLLLNQADPNQVARDLHYLTYLTRAHAELIRGLRGNLARLRDAQRAVQKQSAELAAIRDAQNDQRQRLEAEKRAHQGVLTQVGRQIAQQRREIATLRRDENRLARLVAQLIEALARPQSPKRRLERPANTAPPSPAFSELKGKLPLPVRGELRNRFGGPRQDTGLSWKGLFIAAPAGQEVKTIGAGRVVFGDWLRGFGNLLIIDHGAGYMSLYGNNESLYKQVGDTVNPGETVAAVGNSGGNAESGLYFEVRFQGKAVDPLSWKR